MVPARRINFLLLIHIALLLISCSDTSYSYSPSGCLFQINFPRRPEIKDTKRPTNPHNTSAEVANLILENDSTVLTANFELYSFSFDSVPRSRLLNMLKKEAILKDFPDAEVYYDPDSLGSRYIIKAIKVAKVENSSKDISLLYVDHWYFKKGNLFCVSVVCPVNLYPTKEIREFLGTLKLKG